MMAIFANILVGIALLATAGVLAAGLVAMGLEGRIDEKYANMLMRWRVGIQATAIALMAVAAVLLNI